MDIIAAARAGDVAAIEAALLAGADVDARDERGNTALMCSLMAATCPADRAAVDCLLAHGADVRKYNTYTGNGPIDVAQGRELRDYLRRLKDEGAAQ